MIDRDQDEEDEFEVEALPRTFETGRTVIGIRTAMILYALLAAVSLAALKGKALLLALLIVGGLATKTAIGWMRDRAMSRESE